VVLSTALGLAAFGRPGRTNPLLRGFILPAATAPIAVLVVVTAVGPNGTLYAYVHGCQPFEPQVVTSRPGLHITRRRHA